MEVRKINVAEKWLLKGVYVPMSLVRELGVDVAFLYCYILNKIDGEDRMKVLFSVENVEKETGLNDYIQRKLLKELEARGYVRISFQRRYCTKDTMAPFRFVEIIKPPTDFAANVIVL
jgi:ribosomal protein S19E (S16A)